MVENQADLTATRACITDAGKLSSIFALPMDLLAVVRTPADLSRNMCALAAHADSDPFCTQIFSELEPLNLLHLSRANKQCVRIHSEPCVTAIRPQILTCLCNLSRLNTFLSSRDASPIWAACRKNLVLYIPKVPGDSPFNYDTWEEISGALEPLHMPARPACLTDVAYTRLLFESLCSVSLIIFHGGQLLTLLTSHGPTVQACGGMYAGSEYWSQGMKVCRSCPAE